MVLMKVLSQVTLAKHKLKILLGVTRLLLGMMNESLSRGSNNDYHTALHLSAYSYF
jgi:hypothetical protein